MPLCYAFAFALVMVMGLAGWRELALREARSEKSPKPGLETVTARSASRTLTNPSVRMPVVHSQRCSLHTPFLLTDHACPPAVRRSPSDLINMSAFENMNVHDDNVLGREARAASRAVGGCDGDGTSSCEARRLGAVLCD